jgi:hypothetical protein
MKMCVDLPIGSEGETKSYRFEVSDGLRALCKGIATVKKRDTYGIYENCVKKAVDLGVEPSSRILVLYLNDKYSDEMKGLREDINLD